MALIPTTLDYTDRDFESLRLRLQGLARSVFPTWTDFNTGNFGNLLLEMKAFVGDTLHFYLDANANEAFWPTLRQRISAIRLARLIGFKLSTASSSTGTVRFSIPNVSTKKVLIPQYTKLRTVDPEEPVAFITTAYAEIAVGNTYIDVAVEQAERRSEDFNSTGEPNQEIVLTYGPYLDGSLTLSAAEGSFTEVDSFLEAGSTDKVFVVWVDNDDRAHVRFGNGSNGVIPTGLIQTAYKIGGGAGGNVEAGQISIIEDTIFFDDASTAPVVVANQTATSGGVDRMSIDEARAQAPASLRVLTRTVTREDFENGALSVRGVARALMATSNEDANVLENYGILFIIAQGEKLESGRIMPATPSSTLLTQVYSEIVNNKPPTITFRFETRVAVFKTINIQSRVALEQGADPSTVGTAIRTALKNFFAAQLETGRPNPQVDFGANLKDSTGTIVGEIVWSDVFDVINDIDGVRKVDEGVTGLLLNSIRKTVTLTPVEFPVLGTISLVNMETETAI